MPVQMRFTKDGDLLHCDIAYQGPFGKLMARGTINRRLVADAVNKAVGQHGKARVASVMGCDCNDNAMAKEVDLTAKAMALHRAAGLMGWNPFSAVKNAVTFAVNPLAHARFIARKLRRKRGGGSAPSAPGGGPDDSSPASDDDDSQSDETQTTSQGVELMQQWDIGHRGRRKRHHSAGACSEGDYEIGFLPVALAAYQHRKQLAKIAKSNNPRAANAAKTLAKAKGGDPQAKRKIAVIKHRAKAGDPEAKDAMKRLHAVNTLANRGITGPVSTVRKLFRDGIT